MNIPNSFGVGPSELPGTPSQEENINKEQPAKVGESEVSENNMVPETMTQSQSETQPAATTETPITSLPEETPVNTWPTIESQEKTLSSTPNNEPDVKTIHEAITAIDKPLNGSTSNAAELQDQINRDAEALNPE